MAKAHSSRGRPSRRTRINSSTLTTNPKPPRKAHIDPPDFDEMLGRFSEALALTEAAHDVLECAQDDSVRIGPGVLTLQRGIEELRSVYNEFDMAIPALAGGAT